MLMPRKVKFRKHQRGGKLKGVSKRGTDLAFGEFGMKAQTSGLINSKEIESARRAMTRYVQKGGKIWIRLFPDKPMTRKGSEVPMGKGKGNPEFFVAKVKPGKILFEMDGVERSVAKQAMRLASDKIRVKIKFISKED
jgi:large subunit ribosomal protein L16